MDDILLRGGLGVSHQEEDPLHRTATLFKDPNAEHKMIYKNSDFTNKLNNIDCFATCLNF